VDLDLTRLLSDRIASVIARATSFPASRIGSSFSRRCLGARGRGDGLSVRLPNPLFSRLGTVGLAGGRAVFTVGVPGAWLSPGGNGTSGCLG
jgi:hypothetical protein